MSRVYIYLDLFPSSELIFVDENWDVFHRKVNSLNRDLRGLKKAADPEESTNNHPTSSHSEVFYFATYAWLKHSFINIWHRRCVLWFFMFFTNHSTPWHFACRKVVPEHWFCHHEQDGAGGSAAGKKKTSGDPIPSMGLVHLYTHIYHQNQPSM